MADQLPLGEGALGHGGASRHPLSCHGDYHGGETRFAILARSTPRKRRRASSPNYSGNRACAIGGHDDALPNVFGAPYIGRMPLFLLNYCHPDGRFAGVVVVESYTHLHASMKAEVSGADRGLNFAGATSLMPKVRGRCRRT
jgi:hypothetical protein